MTKTYNYFPYGKLLRKFISGSGHERYLTTQHERDAKTISENSDGTGFDNRGARLYDSDIGRMIGVDALASAAPAWSPYRYAFCNPVMFTDPTGNYETKFVDETGGLIVETNDGSDEVYVVEDQNMESFIEEMSSMVPREDDKDANKNHALGEKMGYNLRDSENQIPGGSIKSHRGRLTLNGYRMGYKDSDFGANPMNFQPGSSSFSVGKTIGKQDREAGKMNKLDPQLKSDPAKFEIKNYERTIYKMHDPFEVVGRTLKNTIN